VWNDQEVQIVRVPMVERNREVCKMFCTSFMSGQSRRFPSWKDAMREGGINRGDLMIMYSMEWVKSVASVASIEQMLGVCNRFWGRPMHGGRMPAGCWPPMLWRKGFFSWGNGPLRRGMEKARGR